MLAILPRIVNRVAFPSVVAARAGMGAGLGATAGARFVAARVSLLGTRRAASTVSVHPSEPKLKPKLKLKPKTQKKTAARVVGRGASTKKGQKTMTKGKPRGRPKTATKPVQPKPKTALPAPPRASPNAFILFFQKYLSGEQKPASLAETAATAKTAAKMWNECSPAQKQPYLDEQAALRAQYVARRDEYYRTVDRGVLRALNKRRRARGKKRLHLPRASGADKKPISGYLRFMGAFRESPEGREIRAEGSRDGQVPMVRLCVAGGQAWRRLSDEEKAAYNREWVKETAEWREKRQAA